MVKKPSKDAPAAESSSISPPSSFEEGALPKLIVFDLDYTLWPFWVDTHVTPPLKASADHSSAKDRTGEGFAFYHEVPSILYSLRERGIKVGAASRTCAPDLGREMLRLLHIADAEGKKRKAIEHFDYLEIYPGSKITHFTKLQKASGLAYEDMLFFDDEARNRNVETLGVTISQGTISSWLCIKMPPFLPRKRLRSNSPEAGPSQPAKKGKAKSVSTTPRKPTLFDDLDAGTGSKNTAEHNKALLDKLTATDEESSLSSLSSDDEFEDVPNAKRQKVDEESEDEDEDIEFEDVETNAVPAPSGPIPSGDLELTLRKDERVSISNPLGMKKGPSKIERQIRVATHQVHVQMLMFHNAVRNAWLCDQELQQILVKQLSPGVVQEIERWRRNSGLEVKEEAPKGKGKGKGMGKGKAKNAKGSKVDVRSQRDWGQPAERLASGEVNMSRGDPLFRLLQVLMSYWRQRFRITAPGLRKLGYMSLERLDQETKSFEKEDHDPERHGEKIRDLKELKECAKSMEGSRDVGAQLFTGLLRGLGLEARLVANLQPVGFGWSQAEEALEKNPRKLKKPKDVNVSDNSSGDDSASEEEKPTSKSTIKKKGKAPAIPKKVSKATPKSARRNLRGDGQKEAPIDLSESEEAPVESDNESIIDVTPAKKRSQASLPYDKDLVTPSYWTEVLSPITNTYTPIDAVVAHVLATNEELLEKFLPPTKSEKAKHITSYVIGHSPDGTAKDVTTRYLKGHMWPGRTKGNRLPVEKVPIHDRRGKIKHYELYDWFKTVMSGYVRGSQKCPRTEIDDHEEATALKPVKREKKVVEEGKESLQYYKNSSEFVLERHLKREEALVPTATHAKMFTVKAKGDSSTEEKVFLRKDVVACKSMETWHKEGRAPTPGEEPLKRVPYRAATTNRRRELAEAEQASGAKVLQGLYSRAQTDWIIPPPIEDGVIPKNAFGNIDLYVDSMLPEGAVHIPYRGTMKICKRLGIDYAEAVTGFEFGHRMAVPIITGVVVAEEHYDTMMAEFEKDEAERVRKEDEKRRKLVVNTWRKYLMGLRIVERMREEYGNDDGGDEVDALNPWTNKKKEKEADKETEAQRRIMEQRDEDNAGGFFPEGHEEEDPDLHRSSGFFPVAHDDDDDDDAGGGFIVEGHDEEPAKSTVGPAYDTPQSLQSTGNPAANHKSEGEEMEDEKTEDIKPDFPAPAPKKRGRPSGSTNKTSTPKPTPKAAPKAKVLTQQKTRTAPRSTGKRKLQIEDSEGEDEENGISSPEPDSSKETPQKPAPKKGARRAMPAKTAANPRKTPRRNAARKSQTALKSHYFEHDGDEEGEDDG
ncbi:DNA repair protein [Lachnellula occidentalis]|uniref:DNA repair protein n=1 Tax=Lachnellula occidentalis TaxID=215460 RepID=A0A8H8S2V0_9HELO|nr:DNA repair protein [Lachnellula occidentalis]